MPEQKPEAGKSLWKKAQDWRENTDGQEKERAADRARFARTLEQALRQGERVERDVYGVLMPNAAGELLYGYLGKRGLVGAAGLVVIGHWTPLALLVVTQHRVLLFCQDARLNDVFGKQEERTPPRLLWTASPSAIRTELFKTRAMRSEGIMRLRRDGVESLVRIRVLPPWVNDGEALAAALRRT